ncbi:ABC transporter ATP-binding protein [Candidatus Odyssella acanthamoebae]|uniref:ABC transporter permease n=1 Tax=Candidatus Odyssella acanthamoebae TaxID=91604 RepID=A0A077AVD5_9PROT|nr:ABC transporter ATP-binding protein [Candidatus Paracaedibacter acanthamoebae]AIK95999.1 ABC transporter permease [Candidatus Paracaedibacter acanthamoebae]
MMKIKAWHVFACILDATGRYKLSIAFMLFLAICWAVDVSLHSFLQKLIIDRITDQPKNIFQAVGTPAILFVLLSFFMSTVFRLYEYLVSVKMIPEMRKYVGQRYISNLLKQSHTFFQDQFSGSLANKINDLTMYVPEIIQIVIDRFFSHFLMLIIATYTLWTVNPVFAYLMIGWTVFFIFLSLIIANRLTQLSDKWSECGSINTGRIVDILSNIMTVRLFARRKYEYAYMSAGFEDAAQAEQRLNWNYFWVWFAYGYSFVFTLALNMYFLLKKRELGVITVGDFALVISLNVGIVDVLWQLTWQFSQFTKCYGKISQALRVLLQPVEITDVADAKPLVVNRGIIKFQNVTFCYKAVDPLFKDLSVTIERGQKVGLVGYSGSGKTTFANLILRLYEVTDGKITIDDQSVKEVMLDTLYQSIGMIPQDPSLFHRTLRENISYGRPEATEAEIIEAAKKACAHDFISRLKEGYETMVGERGVKLSGGQRQRIAIARAILKDAPILILDEATSQLDSLTESYIQDSLLQAMHGKTAIVIAHRLSTLLRMDRILVFNKGQIVQDGSHEDLLNQDGLYKQLWSSQVGGFLPDRYH